MNKVIVVLGMHRSGTSAITRGLEVLGAEFGPELMPAQEGDNEKGFWEDLGIYKINERVLEKIGSRWDAWSHFELDKNQLSLLAEEKQAAITLLRNRVAMHPVYAFKDPRTCSLLPFWQWVFESLENTRIHYLLAIRTPRSVAASLNRRNDFPEKKSHVLWLRHNYAVLSTLPQKAFTVVDYDRLMAAPEKEVMRLAEAIDMPESAIDQGALVEYTQNFLTGDLRHSKFGVDDVAKIRDVPLIGDIYTCLYSLSKDEDIKNQLDNLVPRVKEYFNKQTPFFCYIDSIEEENSTVYRLLHTAKSEGAALQDENEAMKMERQTLMGERDELQSEKSALLGEHKTLMGLHETVLGERDELQHEKSILLGEHESLMALHEKLLGERDELKTEKSALAAEYELLKAERTELVSERDELKTEKSALAAEYELLKAERTELVSERDELKTEKSALAAEYELLKAERTELVSERDELETEKSALEGGLESLQPEHRVLTAEYNKVVSDYAHFRHLSDEKLKQIYSRLHVYDRSLLGRGQALVERIYSVLRLRSQSRSYRRQLIDEANSYLSEKEVNPTEYASPHGRIRLMVKVLAYALRHPYSSLRQFSFYRLKKLVRTILSNDRSLANSWVDGRFPSEPRQQQISLIQENESIDSLKLNFPKVSQPIVSIVVPVFNEYRTTISCLRAVLENSGNLDYEVIVGDDASTDITRNIESRIDNIKVVRANDNQGFLRNCNDAVRKAKGEYVVLLNNDTNVQPGWLQPLIDVIQNNADVGLVGPKLLFADGKLQEAGGIIWKDGSGWNYGRGQDAAQPEFNYLRETDYISGACIMFRKTDWDALKGFDEAFCPAYYEDTDLAFQMRQNGLKVIYQPESEVVHFEGVSNGTDVGSGVKKNQVINQKKFTEKWHEVLEKDHFPNAENVFQARERSSQKRTVVIIDHYVPFYDKDAGSRSTWFYIKAMVDSGLNVKFLPANFFPHQPYTSALQQLGVEVLLGEYYARNWKKWFNDNAEYIDVVYLNRPHVTEDFIDHLTTLSPQPKLVYFGCDLHYLRTQREADLMGDKSLIDQAEDWKKREFKIFEKVDKVLYPSSVEVDEIKREAAHLDIDAIPLYVLSQPEPSAYQHQERKDLLFVGGFGHPPNVDAVVWFVDEILPSVLQELDDVKLHVVGSNVPDSIKKLESENVIIHGFLSDEDLADLYQNVRLSVVPLRFGAGVKGKVLEALQAGLPIVTTSIGAEGIPEAYTVMEISDEADVMADSILRLYKDKEASASYLRQYPDYIEQYFSKNTVQTVIDKNFLN